MGSVLRNNYEDAAALSTNEDNEEMERFKLDKCYVFSLKKYIALLKRYGLDNLYEQLFLWALVIDRREVSGFINSRKGYILLGYENQANPLYVCPEWCDCVNNFQKQIFEIGKIYRFSYEKFKNFFADYPKEFIRRFSTLRSIDGEIVKYECPILASVYKNGAYYEIRPEWCISENEEEVKYGKQ